jgi:hypothetical protein
MSGATIFSRRRARKRRKRQNSNPDRPLGRKVLFDFIFFDARGRVTLKIAPQNNFQTVTAGRREPLFSFFRGTQDTFK